MRKTKNQSRGVPVPPHQMAKTKTIEQLATEQGVRLPQNLDELLGKGRDLSDDDEEFENFLRWLDDSTRRR